MIVIPYEELSAQALEGVIDAYVLREGTDYGHQDFTLDEKRAAVLEALKTGRARIVFHPENEHIEIERLES